MTQAHQITITPAGARVEVSLQGEQLASSDRAVILDETGLRPRYYFPRDDVRMDLLKPTSTVTTCPFKGQASYWSVTSGGEVHEDLVWGYSDPIPQAAGIAGLVCFYDEKGLDVTVDGKPASV